MKPDWLDHHHLDQVKRLQRISALLQDQAGKKDEDVLDARER